MQDGPCLLVAYSCGGAAQNGSITPKTYRETIPTSVTELNARIGARTGMDTLLPGDLLLSRLIQSLLLCGL